MVCLVLRRAAILFWISILIFGIRWLYHWCGWCFVHLANLIASFHIKFLSLVSYSVNVREGGDFRFHGRVVEDNCTVLRVEELRCTFGFSLDKVREVMSLCFHRTLFWIAE